MDKPPARIIGYFDGIEGSWAVGWAADLDAPERVIEVEFFSVAHGGQARVLGRTRANRRRDDLQSIGLKNTGHGFAWRIPKGAAGQQLSVRVADNGVELRSVTPASAPADRPRLAGHFDGIESTHAMGWVADLNMPERIIEVEFFAVSLDGAESEAIGRARADQARPDLQAIGLQPIDHGFDWPIPNISTVFRLGARIVAEDLDDFTLPGSPVDVTLPARTRVAGRSERVEEQLAGGRTAKAVAGKRRRQPAVSYPIVDLVTAADPIADIMAAPEFAACVAFFANSEAARRALVSPHSQALLFSVVRNLKPAHVYEIGTYRASTTEAICRALHANGGGLAHTIDPFGAETVPPIIEKWPFELRQHVQFYGVDSMRFFADTLWRQDRPDLVFVDGNHDYEFALFDIESAGRFLRRSGFIFVDNIEQVGPYVACRDFLQKHPDWREHGGSMARFRPQFPFDPHRTTVVNTQFCVLRAPSAVTIGADPITTGEQSWQRRFVNGITVTLARPTSGTLHVQCVFRTFGSPPTEATIERSVVLDGKAGRVEIPFDTSFRSEDARLPRRVEPWLIWRGDASLELTEEPTLY
jgi:predicted O-methyltransferase YrrM